MRRVVIGRHPDCDLIVDDEYASPRHAAIEQIPGFYVIYDLGSTNGTRLRRRDVVVPVPLGKRTILMTGDLVIIGRTEIPWRLA